MVDLGPSRSTVKALGASCAPPYSTTIDVKRCVSDSSSKTDVKAPCFLRTLYLTYSSQFISLLWFHYLFKRSLSAPSKMVSI